MIPTVVFPRGTGAPGTHKGRPRRNFATGKLLAAGLCAACVLSCPAAKAESAAAPAATPRLFWAGGEGTTRLKAVHALSNGDFLIAGAASDLEWTSPAPRTEWKVPEPRGGGGELTAFVLHVSGDFGSIRRVYHFPRGEIEEVTRIRTTEVPGQPTGAVYLSGQYSRLEGQDGGYWIARVDGNFVDSEPKGLRWMSFIKAPARQAGGYKGVGEYATRQPWDVRSDGVVVCAVGSPHDFGWAALEALDAETGRHWEMPGWFKEGEKRLIALKAGRENSLRSKNEADFLHRQEDENDNPGRRGRFPDDVFFQGPGQSGPGYTGYRVGKAPTQRAGKIAIDRRNNFLYFGHSTQSRLPNGNPDFEPAIVAMDDKGNLLWWARGYKEVERTGENETAHQDAINSPPDQYIDGVAVDYAADKLVVAGRSHGNGVINFWRGNEIVRKPGGSGFQNQITGTAGNIHVMWFGRYGLRDGKIYASTYMAELAEGARTAEPIQGGLLDGWPSPNSGWPNVTTTRLRDFEVDHSGRLHVAANGRRPLTTSNALIQNVKPGHGVSAWTDFVRVYTPDLSSVVYSTIIRGPWNTETGEHAGDKLTLAGIQPIRGGTVVVGSHEAGEGGAVPALPVTGAPRWGSAGFRGREMGVVAVLPVPES